MSRKAKTLGESCSLKEGISPSILVSISIRSDNEVLEPLMILQKIHEAILDIGECFVYLTKLDLDFQSPS